MRKMRLAIVAAVLAYTVLATLSPVRLAAQRPSFRAGVEVVLIDVTVVDGTGFPVGDLKPGDFTVTVDGKPRNILSAQFLSHRAPGIDEMLRVESGQRPPDVLDPQRVGTGRDVIIAVDEDSLEAGEGLLARRAIGRFIDQLFATDRIAIVTIPRLPSRIGLTNNRPELFEALSRINAGLATSLGTHRIGLYEAFQMDRNDGVTAKTVVARECGDPSRFTSGVTSDDESMLVPGCRTQVLMEAKQIAMTERERAQRSLDAWRRLAELLSSIPRPKTLVVVSGGLTPPVSPAEHLRVAAAMVSAQVNLYTLLLERYRFGLPTGPPSPTAADDDSLERVGIEDVTAASGGTLLRATNDFQPEFDRVLHELSGSYLLGVDVQAADRNGSPHNVNVSVNRPGVSVRSRKQYVIGTPSARAGIVNAEPATMTPGAAEVGQSDFDLGSEQLSQNRILTAARDLQGTGDVYLTVTARRVAAAGPGGPAVQVQVTIDPRSVAFTSLDGRRVARLAVSLFCGDSKHQTVGQLWQRVDLSLKDRTYAQYKIQGIPYTARVPVTGNPRFVKVVVYDFKSDLIGAMTAKVK